MFALNTCCVCVNVQYAIESQIRLRGLDVTDSMLIVKPRQVMTSLPLSMTSRRQEVLCERVDWLFQGEDTIRTEDMVSVIEREGDAIALVMLSGVQYYTPVSCSTWRPLLEPDTPRSNGHALYMPMNVKLYNSQHLKWIKTFHQS